MMAAVSKKVILFIVEGPTDEDTLSPVFQKLFQNVRVHFHVVHGDISTESGTDSTNAISIMNKHIKMEMSRYGFKRSDLIRVIHLIDTDGAFIPDADVISSHTEKMKYEDNRIVTSHAEKIIARNERKQRVLTKLSSVGKIGGILYDAYYFSRNLEHVLHNDKGELTDEEKAENADQFADQYANDPEAFIHFISDSDFTVTGNYIETWRFIFDSTNSLHRHCNIHLIFEDTKRLE